MRNRARLGQADRNQPLIVKALEQAHCSVLSLTLVGKGCPDLLVCSEDGRLFLMEVKSEIGKLNDDQVKFHAAWCGPIYIVRTPTDAIDVLSRRSHVSDASGSTAHLEGHAPHGS